MNDRIMADPPVPHRDGYAQGVMFLCTLAGVALLVAAIVGMVWGEG